MVVSILSGVARYEIAQNLHRFTNRLNVLEFTAGIDENGRPKIINR
jgi:hypothetical protein